MYDEIIREIENMVKPKYKLFTAGPVACFPEVLEVMKIQMFSHRSKEYQLIHKDTINRLKRFLEVKEGEVLLFPSSGTGIMEASIRNCVSPGGKVLVTIVGAFGKRYAEVVEKNGRIPIRVEVPLGKPTTPELLEEKLNEHKEVEAVTITYNETSTGVLNPLKELAKVAKEHNKLVFVDAVSAMGGADIKFSDWNIDIVFASSQKAFGVPPGLAVGAFSPEVFEIARKIPNKGWYFDLLLYKKYNDEKHSTPSTPPMPQIFGLNAALRLVEKMGGKQKWLEMYERRARRIREGVKSLGLKLLAEPGYESPTITPVFAPERISGPLIYEKMRERGFELAKGYGDLKEKTFRIGHMGYITEKDIDEMLENLKEVIYELTK